MQKSFPQRHGYVQPKLEQINDLDEETRSLIWNEFYPIVESAGAQDAYLRRVWSDFLKKPADEFPILSRVGHLSVNWGWFKTLIANEKFYQVLSLIEFSLFFFDFERERGFVTTQKSNFSRNIDYVFERENVGYRVINNLVTPITSPEEIAEIETALGQPNKTVSQHIHQALKFLADRENPDYHNSIKESISAVESLLKILVPTKGFGDALKSLRSVGIIADHSALEGAFSQLYGWASDGGGIRHGKGEFADASKEEARYMVIVCSAFVNYLITKQGKAVMAG